jgi:hypothetical protein
MDELMQEGGMADDGMTKEPVTGNDVPPGALASEVRDDVDAKLSGGEYVVPADVLRYYGVRFFEDLRSQAKQGMMEMESAGRIGGVPVDPRGVPMEGQDEELTPEEEQMLAQTMSGMAEGGTVFNREDFTLQDTGSNPIDSRVYFNPSTGKKMTIGFMNGTQLATIPPGFVPWTQALQDTYNATKVKTPKPSSSNRNDDENDPTSSNYNYSSWADKNYEAINSNPYEFGLKALEDTKEGGINLPGLAGGLLSLVTGGANDLQNVAEANASLKLMEARGLADSTEYKTLTEKVKGYISNLSPVEQGMLATKVAGTGNQYIQALDAKKEERAEETPAPTTPANRPTGNTPTAEPTPSSGGSKTSSSRTTDEQQKAAYTAPKPSLGGGVDGPRPTPKPTPRPGSERFAEGGLVAKPKKPRAKTKGLAAKQ